MNTLKMRRFLSGSAPFLPGAFAILLAIAIVAAPESSFAASLQGLKLWWTLVFPALLPFLILSEMLTASGLVHGLGVLLAPLMTRIFRLPGTGGWTLALGMTAGFPAGANGVMQLHKQGHITDKEAGGLASLAHFASPVSLLIVMGSAFLQSPAAGYALLAIHWLSGLLAGCTSAMLMRRNAEHSNGNTVHAKQPNAPLLRRVHSAAAEARTRDGRSFGKILGESVSSAVQSLMAVGGYMIMFAVAINIVTSLIPHMPSPFVSSLLEIHLGAKELTAGMASAGRRSLDVTGYALLSAALAWGGICGQLQALTALKAAGIRYLPFALSRMLHGMYAFICTLLLWEPLMNISAADLPAAAGTAPSLQSAGITSRTVWHTVPQLFGIHTLLVAGLLALSAGVYIIGSLRRQGG